MAYDSTLTSPMMAPALAAGPATVATSIPLYSSPLRAPPPPLLELARGSVRRHSPQRRLDLVRAGTG